LHINPGLNEIFLFFGKRTKIHFIFKSMFYHYLGKENTVNYLIKSNQ
jgi:hypothetical protein